MKKYAMPVIMLVVFETIAITLWLTKGNLFYLFNFSYFVCPFRWASSCLSKNTGMPGALFNCLSVCTCLSISD